MKKPSHHENTLKIQEREKVTCKVIREYFDEKRQCVVKVLAGPNDKPYPRMPVGGGE